MELRIKEIMTERGVTSSWLSAQVGISKVAVSNIITGKSSPSLDNILKIAEALEVDIISLIYGNNKEAKSDLTALIQYKGDFYKASTIEELEKIVFEIKEKSR